MQNHGAAGMIVHQHAHGLADAFRVGGIFGRHHQGHRAGAQHAARIGLVLRHLGPQLLQVAQDSFGLNGRCTHKCVPLTQLFRHCRPSLAIMASASAGPQVPGS